MKKKVNTTWKLCKEKKLIFETILPIFFFIRKTASFVFFYLVSELCIIQVKYSFLNSLLFRNFFLIRYHGVSNMMVT